MTNKLQRPYICWLFPVHHRSIIHSALFTNDWLFENKILWPSHYRNSDCLPMPEYDLAPYQQSNWIFYISLHLHAALPALAIFESAKDFHIFLTFTYFWNAGQLGLEKGKASVNVNSIVILKFFMMLYFNSPFKRGRVSYKTPYAVMLHCTSGWSLRWFNHRHRRDSSGPRGFKRLCKGVH